ncbi:MAG: hypothetical protein RIF33_10730 [Cyclobacteriaceae bacterium]
MTYYTASQIRASETVFRISNSLRTTHPYSHSYRESKMEDAERLCHELPASADRPSAMTAWVESPLPLIRVLTNHYTVRIFKMMK